MEIRQLRYFLDVAATEHLTRSAQNLFVTQSTLSHGIKQLEGELGINLFDRIGRGLKLTHAGLEFKTYATRAIKEIEAGRMALSDLSGLQSGKLIIGAFPTFLYTLVPPTIAAFSMAYPKVSVEVRDLRAGPIELQLLSGELDLGIAFHPTTHDELEAEPLFDEEMLLVVGNKHPLSGRKTVPLHKLHQMPMALLPKTYATRLMIDDKLQEAGAKVQVRVEMESVVALIGVCRDSELATIVPERAAYQAKDIHCLKFTSTEFVRHAGLLWRRGASRSSAANEFAKMLKSSKLT